MRFLIGVCCLWILPLATSLDFSSSGSITGGLSCWATLSHCQRQSASICCLVSSVFVSSTLTSGIVRYSSIEDLRHITYAQGVSLVFALGFHYLVIFKYLHFLPLVGRQILLMYVLATSYVVLANHSQRGL